MLLGLIGAALGERPHPRVAASRRARPRRSLRRKVALLLAAATIAWLPLLALGVLLIG